MTMLRDLRRKWVNGGLDILNYACLHTASALRTFLVDLSWAQ